MIRLRNAIRIRNSRQKIQISHLGGIFISQNPEPCGLLAEMHVFHNSQLDNCRGRCGTSGCSNKTPKIRIKTNFHARLGTPTDTESHRASAEAGRCNFVVLSYPNKYFGDHLAVRKDKSQSARLGRRVLLSRVSLPDQRLSSGSSLLASLPAHKGLGMDSNSVTTLAQFTASNEYGVCASLLLLRYKEVKILFPRFGA